MTIPKARSRRVVSLRAYFDTKTGQIRWQANIEVAPGEFIENPLAQLLAPKEKRERRNLPVIDGGRVQ